MCAVIKSESNWDPEAESNQGAQGLMQLMPETAQDMIAKGSYGDTTLNGLVVNRIGMGNVDGWAQQNTSLHNAITFPETQAYLIRVNNAWVRYKTLYPDRFV